MMINALSHRSGHIENAIITPVKLKSIPDGHTVETLAIWDTGATGSVITATAAEALALKPVSRAIVRGVHGTREVNVYYINITLNNENITLNAQVTESEALSGDGGIGMLIGMNIITMGDFAVTNHNGKTAMTFRVPSLEEMDFVREIQESNFYLKRHEAMSKSGNDKCPCGSGKLWKNCHGRSKYLDV